MPLGQHIITVRQTNSAKILLPPCCDKGDPALFPIACPLKPHFNLDYAETLFPIMSIGIVDNISKALCQGKFY
jgi:hypothetical protein